MNDDDPNDDNKYACLHRPPLVHCKYPIIQYWLSFIPWQLTLACLLLCQFANASNAFLIRSYLQIQRESQPPKAISAKFQRSTQKKSATLNSTSQESSVSLLEILRRSSLHAEHCVQNAKAQQKESVFDAFKLAKKPIKTDARVWCIMGNFGHILMVVPLSLIMWIV